VRLLAEFGHACSEAPSVDELLSRGEETPPWRH
jgi:hypothetical protein